MIGYVTLGTRELARAEAFYTQLLGLLGAQPFFRSERGIGFGVAPDKPMLSILHPFDGEAASAGNGTMVALAASNPEQVQALHAKALELGGKDEGAPGARGGTFYAAYFRDLDGNKLSAFCRT